VEDGTGGELMMKRGSACFLFSSVLVTGLVSGAAAESGKPGSYSLNHINPHYVVTAEEAYQWHVYKDKGGPTYAGSESWRSFLGFCEERLREYGVTDLEKNKWTYDRWYTSDWPNDTNWTLISDGRPVVVAHYGAYSGSTPPEGITAQMVYYDRANPPKSIEGKVVVLETSSHPKPPYDERYTRWFTINDYEYLSRPNTFSPMFTPIPPSETISLDVWWELRQTIYFRKLLVEGKAAGAVIVFNMSYDRTAGLYSFLVPTLYEVPTLYLDRMNGAGVIEDARGKKKATLKLLATIEPTETYQLIGYLPGKDYGTKKDEQILVRSHTDGPSIAQDNGAFGVVGIVKYFSQIPQEERPRTLMVYLDCRHYMPGMEEAFAGQDYFARHPEAQKNIVALVATEHLGQVEYKEVGEVLAPTGRVEPSFLWTRSDQRLIDLAIQAVKDNEWPRCSVQAPERPGIHGKPQGVWYGMGELGLGDAWDLPSFGTMGTQGSYWATTARINKFDPNLFSTQVAAMSQLTGELMVMDLEQAR
jgi:hypothetical protein